MPGHNCQITYNIIICFTLHNRSAMKAKLTIIFKMREREIRNFPGLVISYFTQGTKGLQYDSVLILCVCYELLIAITGVWPAACIRPLDPPFFWPRRLLPCNKMPYRPKRVRRSQRLRDGIIREIQRWWKLKNLEVELIKRMRNMGVWYRSQSQPSVFMTAGR